MAQLAQLNIARLKFAPDDPAMADFNNAIEAVNASAEASKGFVWRYVAGATGSPALAEFESQGWLVNISVWTSVDALKTFLRSPLHLSIMKRRAEWFSRVEHHLALWWVEDGHHPGFEEARERLESIATNGPTRQAFTFSTAFPPPGR